MIEAGLFLLLRKHVVKTKFSILVQQHRASKKSPALAGLFSMMRRA